MNQTDQPKTTLQRMLTSSLFIEEYDLEDLAEWCGRSYPNLESCREFKMQLRAAIDHPGTVTPQMYESWTADDGFPTQDKLQEHLKEVWNACFPTETLV